MRKHDAHLLFPKHLVELGLEFTAEYRFNDRRRWRFDYIITNRLKHGLTPAVELEGGIWTQGRHTRGSGYQQDLHKYNMAAAAGFLVFRFSTAEVLQGKAKQFLKEHIL